jgi:hypothetical protein
MPPSRNAVRRPTLADGTDHARLRALRLGCEQFIADSRWDLYCTLTFRFAVSEAEAVKEFEQKYIQRLQQRSQGRVTYIAVAAKNWTGGRVHVHALLLFVQPLALSASKAAWKAGQAKVDAFDPRRGAGGYISRHVALPDVETMVRQ